MPVLGGCIPGGTSILDSRVLGHGLLNTKLPVLREF